MKIAAGLNFFLEAKNLPKTLETIKDFDVIIAVDGRYPHFDYREKLSDDGSREILKKYPNVVLLDCPDDQITKRNLYLQYAKKLGCDFLLVVDADFTVKVDWEVFRSELARLKKSTHLIFNVAFSVSNSLLHFALLYKPDRVEYHQIHHLLRCKRCHFEMDVTARHTPTVRGVEGRHHTGTNKSAEHMRGRKSYRLWKQGYENKLREKRKMMPVYGAE